jgi:carboxyl-terminal processing protease
MEARNIPGGISESGTASAAEIVAGAIQDHDCGLIAGEKTFGKGLVQTVSSGGEYWAGTDYCEVLHPSGRLIQRLPNVSLYDYYYNRGGQENNGSHE